MKVKKALIWGAKELKKTKSSALDAEVLLVFVLKKDKTWLFSHLDVDLSAKLIKKYRKLISRRKKEEPIAYIIHHKEFFGHDFYVDKSVLIPRPETESLVEEAIKAIDKCHPALDAGSSRFRVKPGMTRLKILDLGTGSGCIIIALAKIIQNRHSESLDYSRDRLISESVKIPKQSLPRTRCGVRDDIYFYTTDISPQALKIAKKNAKKRKVKIKFIKSDLFENISKTKFDLIVANLPYLEKKDIKNDLIFEPKRALIGGKKSESKIIRFIAEAKDYLNQEGKIIIEIGPRQAESILKIAKNIYPDKKILLKKDLAGLDRVVIIR